MKKMIALMVLLNATIAVAELPPFYQSTNELSALLEMEELAEVMNPDAIQRIRRKKHRGDVYYEVDSKGCKVVVQVNKLPTEPGWAGAAPFEMELIHANCK